MDESKATKTPWPLDLAPSIPAGSSALMLNGKPPLFAIRVLVEANYQLALREVNAARWIPVAEKLPGLPPKVSKRRGLGFGRPVLIWPLHESEGSAPQHVAYYGDRASAEPLFYLHGAALHPQPHFWKELPCGPQEDE